jgi:hypothetical protein
MRLELNFMYNLDDISLQMVSDGKIKCSVSN